MMIHEKVIKKANHGDSLKEAGGDRGGTQAVSSKRSLGLIVDFKGVNAGFLEERVSTFVNKLLGSFNLQSMLVDAFRNFSVLSPTTQFRPI
jgi:hypothetical protein